MPNRKSNLKPAGCLLVGILAVLAVYGLLFHDAIANDIRLTKIKQQLNQLPQPPDTTLISSNAAVGLLQGNGNHCDYFVGSVYRSRSSEEAIRKHYEGRQFQNPVTENLENWEITILKDQNAISSMWLPYDFDRSEAWGLSSRDYSTETVYLVHAMRSYQANGDWRCH